MKTVARMLLTASLLQPVLLAQTSTAPDTPPRPNPVPGAAVQQLKVLQPGTALPIRLVLDEAPKFSTFTAADLKFLLPQPQQDLRWSKSLESAGPLALTFASKDKAAPPVSVTQFSISFRAVDLTPRGEYYPEAHPVGPETPVKGAYINGSLPGGEVPALLAYFKIPSERAEIWIKNEFWKDGGPLKLTGEVPGGRVTLTLGGNPQDETRNWVQIQIKWLEDPSPNSIPPGDPERAPRPRVVPPSGQ
ncbi:hypothetical protein OVA24_18790 [Luteolibacter sp. SL250]|uniref:hypothetical protein n=1 Tax=Luteolibacter sp. SL250 TaxID=2995170 RepID=UPI00226FFB54|nr:hypothetical protein [Luteolibacter sp. SL250]WAC19277.1 hypothetical protein OVA24_18790 [Luteolibacter sp. SL250]